MSTVGNVLQFRKTLGAIKEGGYDCAGTRVTFSHTADELAMAQYWPESEVLALDGLPRDSLGRFMGCAVQVSNEDTFACAERIVGQDLEDGCEPPPLVLNFANPHTPGGGVRLGASAQEEDLCRRSTLYASIASEGAAGFYRDNHAADKCLFSHGVLISPCVEVIADAKGRPLDEPFTVAVMTVPAPYAKGMHGDRASLNEVISMRIRGMLGVAARNGYTRLVLGAWGCGAFGNDPADMAESFVEGFAGYGVHLTQREGSSPCPFKLVCFAVLDKSVSRKTYQAFASRMVGW